jgi:hypothetical protein
LASVDVIEFQTTDAYSILDLTKVMYKRNIHILKPDIRNLLNLIKYNSIR